MDNIEIIKEMFQGDRFSQQFRIVLDELTHNSVKMHMKLELNMNNLYGRPHGGAIYCLADAAFSVLGNNKNNISLALDSSITYPSSPETGQILYVEGELINQTRKIGSYLFSLYKKVYENKKKIATMMSRLYRTGKPINSNFKTG